MHFPSATDYSVCVSGLNKDSPYSYVNGVLRDGDGDEIKLVDPKNYSTAISKLTPQIKTPVRRKRNVNVTPPFLGRNVRLGATMSPVSHKRNGTDVRRKRPRRSVALNGIFRFPFRSRSTRARTKRLKAGLSQLYESILSEERRRGGRQAAAVTRTINRMTSLNVFTNTINAWCAYTVAYPGNFISSDVLLYGLNSWCPRQFIPYHYLGSPRRHSFCFQAVGPHENAAQHVAQMQRRCLGYTEVIESGKCLVLPYNYPVDVHWMCVLAWKDTSTNPAGYLVQPRNSMSSLRRHDGRCIQDAKTFLKGLYEYAGVPAHALPKWSEAPTCVDVAEQARGENSCCLHTLGQAILAFHGTWRNQSFSERFVHSMRLHMLDHMGVDGFNIRVSARSNTTTAVGRTRHMNLRRKLRVSTRSNTTTAVGRIRHMNVKAKYFNQISRLEKTKECRLWYPSYKRYQVGDVIRFNNRIDRIVTHIETYEDLEEMLRTETVRACLPHLRENDVKQGVSEYMSFLKGKDLSIGFVVFHLSPMSRNEGSKKIFQFQEPKPVSGVRKKVELFNR